MGGTGIAGPTRETPAVGNLATHRPQQLVPERRRPTANASFREHPRAPKHFPNLLHDFMSLRPRDRLARNHYGLPPFLNARRDLPPSLPQKAPSPVPGHRPANPPPSDPGPSWLPCSSREVHYHPLRAHSRAGLQDALDLSRSAQLRQRASLDPSPSVWQGFSVPPGCASSDGTRGSAFAFAY